VNDAAAIAAASRVGVHGGAEASLAAADVYHASRSDAAGGAYRGSATHDEPHPARILLSLGYNAVGVGLAVAG
jgi:hypothetical protein